MNKKNLLVAATVLFMCLIILTVTVIGVLLYVQNRDLNQKLAEVQTTLNNNDQTKSDSNTNQDSDINHETPETNSMQIIDKQITEDTEVYRLDMTYPELSGYSEEDIQATFNDLVFYKVNSLAREIRFGEEGMGGVKNFIESDYAVRYMAQDYISLLITNNVYTGGAHPNPVLISINYDLKNNQELELQDLFNGAGYLDIISEKSITLLSAEFGDDFIDSGASTNPNNFNNFTFDASSLFITFDTYQVGPYAIGTPEVEISLSDFGSILKVSFNN